MQIDVRRRVLVCLMVALAAGCGGSPNDSPPEDGGSGSSGSTPGALRVTTLALGLDTPWDLAWGPDGRIWVTERRGTISRVDTTSGEVTQVGQVGATEVSESRLMGMAFHPDFEIQPFVYAVYSFNAAEGIRNRLVRMRFDGTALGAPETLVDNIPGAPNHDGARLAVGPDGLLYMTTGDAQTAALAQDLNSLAGKILRVDLDGREVTGGEALFIGQFGRLRDVLVGPRGEVYLATSNRDGRGQPRSEDDRILRVEP